MLLITGTTYLKDWNRASDRGTIRGAEIMQTSSSKVEKQDGVENTRGSFTEGNTFSPCDDEIDAQIWEPPEPEDPEDDIESSVALYDDEDDEYGDGTIWAKSSSLSLLRDERSGSYRFKEATKRMMQEMIKGKFKALVNQLLKSAGVSCCGEGGESWVDIVSSLSWEAASCLKPNDTDSKTMDSDGCFKVKCIPTGSRSQSQVIKGLVFTKHPAHKHMPTKYKNPRLLLISDKLCQSSSGLTSFNSMEQENNYTKLIFDMIEMCQPNVILVEKTVSRDIQEYIFAKGMTLVFDMKLHRLERVSRCTGSPIVSTDNLMNQNLKHCDSFHFERFVKEHAGFCQEGKKQSKTWMFVEGFPMCFGRTILLKGAHSDELKRIKCVVRCAAIIAYHIIIEISFLVDQRAMFSTIPFAGVANESAVDQQSPRFHEGSRDPKSVLEGNSIFLDETLTQLMFSGLSLSTSPSKVFRDTCPLSSYSDFNGRETDGNIMDSKTSSEEIKSTDGAKPWSSSDCSETSLSMQKFSRSIEDQMQSNDDINTVLDSQSMLVLVSRRNSVRGINCEHSHFSRIKFYKDSDIPLGKFLQENILSQGSLCSVCGELPEAHCYYYDHNNQQLTIQVKQLPLDKRLPGETEGKLWMWSHCGKCNPGERTAISTKRVLISTSARGLSFGKFLEFSFCHHSSSSILASCGNSMHRDFLYFFGLGSMVAMFRYSLLETYTVSMPPLRLEFNNSIRPDWLDKETENVYAKGISLFMEVENFLKKIGSRFTGSILYVRGSFKELSDIEEMCKQERSKFEVNIQNLVSKNGNPDQTVYNFLGLNRLQWKLLLLSCIWNRRLQSLLSPNTISSTSGGNEVRVVLLGSGENDANMKVSLETGTPIKEIPVEGHVQKSGEQNDLFHISSVPEDINRSTLGSLSMSRSSDQEFIVIPNVSANRHLQMERIVPVSADIDNDLNASKGGSSQQSLLRLKNSNDWFWMSFSEIRHLDTRDLYLQRFESTNRYTQEYLPTAYQLITEEGSRLHIPLGSDKNIVSAHDGELSSIISCALALLKDLPVLVDNLNVDSKRDSGMTAKTTESLHSVVRIPTVTSPRWSANDSLASDVAQSPPSISSASDKPHFTSFDGLNLLDTPQTHSAEISLGVAKSHGKGKYTVICLYANEFRHLRNQCCLSELDFINSLSRCTDWDAKGGKSKSYFAKTLDDMFIIKEIQKTEFESFEKFAPHYFNYMDQSFTSGNQTCLAKVLGVYQVIIRQTRNGKEARHDLMVMENLTYGRNITRQYDLKGALHARYNSATDDSGDVLLDQNFIEDMERSPLYVTNKGKRFLLRAIWNDTSFLNSINVMDYSLLVVVDTQQQELVCGIIDYFRQYTWDKQLETMVKSPLVPKNLLPTVISPKEYKIRLRKFLSTHFLSVPDHCNLCSFKEQQHSSL